MAFEADTGDHDLQAAEYVLGLLEGDALAAAQMRLRDDPAFAEEVDRWTSHFGSWFDEWPAVEPPPALAARIMAAAGKPVANDNIARPWKWATAISTSIAAALALVLLTRPPAEAPVPTVPVPAAAAPMTVAFAVADQGVTLPALVDTTAHELRLPRGLDVPTGRAAQLWLIEGETAPQPLGVFRPTSNGLVAAITIERPIPAGAVLAISIEPPGGSPTGAPTGPVVATGEITPI